MINKEEEKLKKKNEQNENQKINNQHYISDDLIKNNLIKFLEVQIQESEEKILKKEIKIEEEKLIVFNRLNKEIEKSQKFSLEKLIIDFLPIVDNIDRALNSIENTELNKNFLDIFKKLKFISNLLEEFFILFHIKKIANINVPFNPSIHQAMSIHYTDKLESNQIVTVMQPGYILHESRLLRPAMVVVSKKRI